MTEPIPVVSEPAAVAFVQSCWHRDIVDRCRDAFLVAMSGSPDLTVELFEVPGAFELPLHTQLLCRTGRYRAVVAAGFVVDGGIYRHDFVAEAVLGGLMRVQLDTGIPVLSAVLTPHHFHDHDVHSEFFGQHMVTKGEEVAAACLATCANVKNLATVA
jgi:6,7-dimethyl-8-ribityllumazine synthase